MKADFVFHIGANKTGSSAIQHFIRNNLQLLEDHDFLVPDRELTWTERITGEHVFALQTLFNTRATPDDLLKVFKSLKDSSENDGTILLSAENLSNPGSPQWFTEVCKAYSCKVILYIRRQDDLIASSWQQWHSKGERDFDAWLLRGVRTIGHWETIIQRWEALVGKGNVDIRIFERQEFPDGNIMADFLVALGIDPDKVDADYSGTNINPSFSDMMTPLVAANPGIFEGPHDNRFYKLVQNLTGTTYSTGPKISLMTPKQRDFIVETFENQNRRVCADHFPGRARLFKMVDHSKYRYLSREELLEEQLQFMTRMIFEIGMRLELI